MIQIKRVYSEPDRHDGLRILVDRVWPRGFSKERANVDEWRQRVSTEHRTTQMVRPRAGKVDRVS